ncbi:pilus assembly PilX N-terminal domain-containing protein [Anaerobacillus sp. MEB173]|uniref:pilus assembly PilX N-terminal domain-containing protein n=1 Tax=Anaerobacillus sp. MEB173 TaxID=3383345 RepID=UPI003F9237D4
MTYFNEKGAALILVLLITSVFTILGMSLISMNISNTKQVNLREGDLQATNLAEMGIDSSHNILNKQIALAIDDVKKDPNFRTSNHDRLFCQKLDNRIKLGVFPQTKQVNNESYKYTLSGPSSISCENLESIKINIKSIGTVGNMSQTQKTINATFTIGNESERESSERDGLNGPSSDLEVYTSTVNISGRSEAQYFSSMRFSNDVTLGGNGSLLIIGGEAYFEKLLRFNGNNAILTVTGDAYFNRPVDFRGLGNNSICINGDSYIYKNNKWETYHEIVNNDDDLCNTTVINPEYHYDVNRWKLINDELTVTY